MPHDVMKILQRANAICEERAKAYSSAPLLQGGVRGILTRMFDKIHRIEAMTVNKTQSSESIEDSFIDLINYSALAVSHMEGKITQPIRLVYLCGPIDKVSREHASTWRDETSKALSPHKIATFNPFSAFTNSVTRCPEKLRHINRAAIDVSDVILCNITDHRCFGSVREIEYAVSVGKRVICVTDGNVPIDVFDVEMYDTISDAVSAIIRSNGT